MYGIGKRPIRDSDIATAYAPQPARFSRQKDSDGDGDGAATGVLTRVIWRPDRTVRRRLVAAHRRFIDSEWNSAGRACYGRRMRHLIALCLVAANVCVAQTNSDGPLPSRSAPNLQADGVRRAVLDYVEGFYEGDTAKLVRVLRPEMYKYGFWKGGDATSYSGSQMTYAAAIKYARDVKANNRQTPASAPREVTIYEVLDQTASAKVRATWGIDYLLLAKYDGKWMITHVLWQGPTAAVAP
jgi:hypothetical protein